MTYPETGYKQLALAAGHLRDEAYHVCDCESSRGNCVVEGSNAVAGLLEKAVMLGCRGEIDGGSGRLVVYATEAVNDTSVQATKINRGCEQKALRIVSC